MTPSSAAHPAIAPTSTIVLSLRRPKISNLGIKPCTTISQVTTATTSAKTRSCQRGATSATYAPEMNPPDRRPSRPNTSMPTPTLNAAATSSRPGGYPVTAGALLWPTGCVSGAISRSAAKR